MVISQRRSKRTSTSSRYKKNRTKRLFEQGRVPSLTKVDERKLKIIRTKGGNHKQVLLNENIANLLDKKTKKYSKVKIVSVVETPSNRHFVRRNIMTKGSFIQTEKGKAVITNRPGQEGTINAVLV
ncbi:30S ribosomal protein S8e [Candidatus Woesearchaeota archaeon CG10_big_fil_rev_8_21_14_0_10_33_12]|nr:MAG: 30S ribosomal protein S8e [Candidatus Woesearchaeota archaeon CG10_big_fil_rev_8_21_14_0_10_33_12]